MSSRHSLDLCVAWVGANLLNAGQAGIVALIC